jgi:hypothetical protein
MKRDTPLLLTPTEQPISLDVLREKYLKADEQTVGDLYARVAKALASVEAPDAQAEWDARFLANLNAGAIGAGRIMSAAGTGIQATLINCFVQPVGDCIQGTDERATPASMKRCAKPPKPCAAAAVSAMTSRASARERCGGQGHRVAGVGAVQLHQRVRPVVLHGGECGCAPRRTDGRAAH